MEFKDHSSINQALWTGFELDYIDARVKKVLSLLPQLGADAAYLDIGCSAGAITGHCADRIGTKDVHGVDIGGVDEARNRGVKAVSVDLNKGESLPYSDKCFDVITCLETLEHLYDPDFILSEIWRLLKPGGLVVVDVPRLDSLMNILLLTLGYQPPGVECSTHSRYGAINATSMLTGHVSYFTRKAFLEILGSNGFTVKKFMQVGQAGNWLEAQKKLGQKVGVLPRLAWSLYSLFPFKKDYMITLLHQK